MTAVTVGSVHLPNAVMTASGTAGYGAELGAYFDLSTLGAVVVKSLSAEPWKGNPPPRLRPTSAGMLNSVGLQNGGIERWLETHLPALRAAGARVVASIWGFTVDDYARAAAMLAGADVVAVEVNLSCPNLDGGNHMFAHSPVDAAHVIAATSVCSHPRWAKLSPNTPELVDVACAVVEAGADALTLINTVMAMKGDMRGGLSGIAIHPIALRAVVQCREACPDVGIVGVGGVGRGADAFALLRAGADAIQVGTATFADPRAPARVLRELTRIQQATRQG